MKCSLGPSVHSKLNKSASTINISPNLLPVIIDLLPSLVFLTPIIWNLYILLYTYEPTVSCIGNHQQKLMTLCLHLA